MQESSFLEDWDEIGTKIAKKGHVLPKSGIDSELVSIQRVNALETARHTLSTIQSKLIDIIALTCMSELKCTIFGHFRRRLTANMAIFQVFSIRKN